MIRKISLILTFSFLLLGLLKVNGEGGISMKLTSPDFKNNEYLPKKFTCDGKAINPSLNIESIPDNAKSLALIVDDPDAPAGTFIHWIVFDIPVTNKIAENTAPGKQGITSSRTKEYVSPCPPSGTHRYFFKIYALDTMLNLKEGITKQELEAAMKGHIVAQAEMIGLYKR
ncbi:MAG: YbhB/YbcL family Raf kinase inhibitor-like protein [Candidatus Omnitrophica bacterium]|jgi:hypothetical protein|nr:YbhB/YbcL family Raf kinase inhibitor-like protein [Candidatus Omnitrophota bacterium]